MTPEEIAFLVADARNCAAKPDTMLQLWRSKLARCADLIEAQAAALATLRANRFASFGGADWFWRVMDPDDSADTPAECINRSYVGLFVVCEIASSYRGPTRFGFNAPVLDPDSDDEEFLHFETQEEALAAAIARREALKGGA